jgi:predicted transcriptional regulator
MPTPDLTNLLGFRQAQIMQLLWAHGPATVRELHTLLTADSPLSYNAVLTMCSRLCEKGLLERQRVIPGDVVSRAKQAYVYHAQLSEVDLHAA